MAIVRTIGETIKSGSASYIKKDEIDAPFTTIQKRAKVSNSLQALMGNERIHVNSVNKLISELGPNGEFVYEPDNGDSRVRFIGNWITRFDTKGQYVENTLQNNTVEVTFYGTGLNLLFELNANLADFSVSVDNAAYGANVVPASYSSILSSRNYKSNQVLTLASGLALGWHKVSIRDNANIGGLFLRLYGFEIVNEASQITVKGGTLYADSDTFEITDQLLDYKLGFDNIADVNIGNRGGRSVIYLDPADGLIKKRFTKTNTDVTEGNPTELVTNGDFTTDISGWTNYGGATWNAGKLRIPGNVPTRVVEQAITTVIGQTYTLSFEYDNITNAAGDGAFIAAYTGANATGTNLGQVGAGGTGVGSLSVSFTATTTSTYLYVSVGDNVDLVEYDNISVKESAYNFLALDDTDHTNESLTRKINYTEFGRDRADDWSTIGAGSNYRSFVLDDGTTTLVGNNVVSAGAQKGFRNTENTGYFTLTFVGTGLDVSRIAHDTLGGASDADVTDVVIDGVVVGTSQTILAGKNITKICSGLPYGTHTVKFDLNGEGGRDVYYEDFIIYGPKKPELPENAVEIAEYNVLADYAALSSTEHDVNEDMSVGVMRKSSTREGISVGGGWSSGNHDDANLIDFWGVYTSTNGDYIERTFWGTSFDWRIWGQSAGNTGDFQASLNGNTDFSSYTTSTIGSEVSFTAATGTYNGTVSNNGVRGLSVSGLPLGLHTVRFTKLNGSRMFAGVLDVGTPIYSPHLTFGSRSLKDLRNFDSNKEANKEIKRTNVDTSFSGSNLLIKKSEGIAQIYRTGTGIYLICMEEPFNDPHYQMQGVVNSSGHIFNFSAILKNLSTIQVATLSHNGSYTNYEEAVVNLTGTQQKDELEE